MLIVCGDRSTCGVWALLFPDLSLMAPLRWILRPRVKKSKVTTETKPGDECWLLGYDHLSDILIQIFSSISCHLCISLDGEMASHATLVSTSPLYSRLCENCNLTDWFTHFLQVTLRTITPFYHLMAFTGSLLLAAQSRVQSVSSDHGAAGRRTTRGREGALDKLVVFPQRVYCKVSYMPDLLRTRA